jgi:molybdopterin-binding protein
MSRNYIEFLQVKVKSMGPGQSKLIVYISIGLTAVITKQAVHELLIELNEMISRDSPKLAQSSSVA